MASLKNLQDLRTILSRLNAERPAGDGNRKGETKYQGRGDDLQKRMTLELESRRGKARVLVTGQIGVGKSSELLYFIHKHQVREERSGFWVYCDLEREESPERCGATGVFLTIFRDCWGATRNFRNRSSLNYRFEKLFLQLRDEIIERLIDWLKGKRSEDGQKVIFQFGGMDYPIFLGEQRKGEALALILGKSAQHEAVSQRSERFGLVPDSLINLLNKLLKFLTDVFHDQPPVLIIDHVDKIRDEPSARESLIEVIPQWKRIEASIIMTAPYEYTLGDMRYPVENYWGKPLMVHPLEFPELGNEDIPSFYLEIIKHCRLENLILPKCLNSLVHFSGGIPRTFIHFLIEVCKEAHLAGHDRIEISDAQSVIYNAERAYQDYGSEELDLLDHIDQKKIGLRSAATLLRSPIGLLVMKPKKEAPGEQHLRVHPLAEKLLERYRLKREMALT